MYAPNTPPITPGIARRTKSARETFFIDRWEMPEARVVKISAACVQAEDTAEDTPNVRRNVEQLTPYAMPSVPSMSCARNPTARQIKKTFIISNSL